MSLVEPTHNAPATRTGPLISSTGCMVAGSTISRYSSFNLSERGIVAAAARTIGGGPLLAARNPAPRFVQRLIQADREPTLVGAQMAVARAHREAVGFAHGRHADDGDRQIEVGDEPLDDRELLRVLLAEVRAVRLHHLKELQHDSRHAAEMSGAELPAQMIGKASDVDGALRRLRVHLRRRRRKHDVDAMLAAERDIGIERARIAREIVLAVELERVDEDRDDHDAALAAGGVDQRRMSGMQRAHRRARAPIGACRAASRSRRRAAG